MSGRFVPHGEGRFTSPNAMVLSGSGTLPCASGMPRTPHPVYGGRQLRDSGYPGRIDATAPGRIRLRRLAIIHLWLSRKDLRGNALLMLCNCILAVTCNRRFPLTSTADQHLSGRVRDHRQRAVAGLNADRIETRGHEPASVVPAIPHQGLRSSRTSSREGSKSETRTISTSVWQRDAIE
jgi:hypothetical protein